MSSTSASDIPTHIIDLISIVDSRITGINLYPRRAEITRLFKLTIKSGLNRVNISGLPTIIDPDSLRVEGKGSAIIHDVIFSLAPHLLSNPPGLKSLLRERGLLEKSLQRCNDTLTSLKTYLNTLNAQHHDVTQLSKVIEFYNTVAEPLDIKALDLVEKISLVNERIIAAQSSSVTSGENNRLRGIVGIDISSKTDSPIQITLVYAVQNTSWKAKYDIRASANDGPISMIYKASISQNTGESWNNVPLILETTNPTLGVGPVPNLTPWNIRLQQQNPHNLVYGMYRTAIPPSSSLSTTRSVIQTRDDKPEPVPEEMMMNSTSLTPSMGDFSATFHISGLINIPSDDTAHTVTITELTLDASMLWVTIPKRDIKVYLKARLTNTSNYTLLNGTANMFVDGSFTSRSSVSAVSPQEAFELDLGPDPSIRVTYHPRSKQSTSGGSCHEQITAQNATQRITVFNNKPITVKIKVIDQIPVSEDQNLTVKLVTPTLTIPNPVNDIKTTLEAPTTAMVKIGEDIIAQWEGPEENKLQTKGGDGIFSWLCALQPQGAAHLTFEWEVISHESGYMIVGL